MQDILLKTLFMFFLAFAIAMTVALMIYLIRTVLTSPKLERILHGSSKPSVIKRVRKIYRSDWDDVETDYEHVEHNDAPDFYYRINKGIRQEDDIYESRRSIILRSGLRKRRKKD